MTFRFLCSQCQRLLPLEAFRVEAGALIVRCPQCGAENRAENAQGASEPPLPGPSSPPPTRAPALPAISLASTGQGSNVVVLRTATLEGSEQAQRAADEDPFAIPEGVCPKCIAPRVAAPSCPACGVQFEGFDQASMLPPSWLRKEWVAVLRDWSNEAKHAQLRQSAYLSDSLPAIGRLYRLRQAFVPLDPVAEQGRSEVLRLAAATSFRTGTEGVPLRRDRILLAAVLMVACFLLLLLMKVLHPG